MPWIGFFSDASSKKKMSDDTDPWMYLTRSHGLVHLQVPQMVSNLTFSYSGQYLILQVLAFAVCDLGGVATYLRCLELHHLMVAAAKAALELHILYEPLFVGENEVQHGTSPHWLLCHLEKEVIDAFQEPPGLLMDCCAVHSTDVRVVEVHHEDQSL
ncbi:obscurihypothetical protein [Limosa lapponica baueri]|uniref:Uncharacterized protein n=1 Tax=Limosa lapponica baueri TaxID=1758121 RepID=A0A2I0U3K8_LIMLA|nr:obscurihypothetical protein [Limosa lapponica baueri]